MYTGKYVHSLTFITKVGQILYDVGFIREGKTMFNF